MLNVWGVQQGIFDLAGGARSYLFSNRSNPEGTPNWLMSDLESIVDFNFNRYGELFIDGNWQGIVTNNAIRLGVFFNLSQYFGLALAEIITAPIPESTWGGDNSASPPSHIPWFTRGHPAEHESVAGLFAIGNIRGEANSTAGFRPIIAGS